MPLSNHQAKQKPAYVWDASGVMVGFLVAGSVILVAALLVLRVQPFALATPVAVALILIGMVPTILGLAMLQYGLVGKLRTRDALIGLIDWRGDEAVLDVGTGAGTLLIAAAKRLDRGGRATGIDIWSAKDLSNNSSAATLRNSAIEGVADRVDVQTGDATALTFADASFDIVVSLLCLHNIEPKPDQVRACAEIARVLKPGGRVVIGDYVPTHDYAAALRSAGLRIERSRSAFAIAGALMWILVADKPLAQDAP